ncbi:MULTISPECIES: DHA2 family efflux MFS transporter permease subunit [Kitasatospora]|uniref:Putative drug resistance protein n=1 Tax=Kitasatospora setae (strain ATCC 33774 / DSM 43861 / JCM 3304 / KCC A-0304 / NBRC 14216 / KM-6054) TaxID=452652 RepID=E4NCU2_KITSK|nr:MULTISPECIES: DHA2 family efflux MFS transporter permease subunit [Kitasatospora]BAJ29023.1 putative drug resistance protein [Kitasatospora setae KM-6054]
MNRQAVWTLVVVSVASFMAGLDNLVVTTALPAIRTDLGGALADLEWTVSGYTLTFAVLLMLGAALGDRFGRRRMFLVGLTVFTLGSASAALAPTMGTLIAARAVQGVGAAITMPLTLTLLTVAVPAARRGMAFGIWSGVSGLAVATGPLIGGSLTEHFSWQWIFWVNVPVGLLLLPLARAVLAESRGENPRLDLPGTLLVSGGLFGVVLGLVRGNPDGWTDPLVLTALTAGVLLLAAFVGYEIRWAKRPMLPMRLFRSRAFSAVNAASLLMFLGMFGSIFLISQYFQGVNGYTAEQAGVRMLPWTAMPLLVAPFAGILTDRIGGRSIVVTGLVLQALGLLGLALLAEYSEGYGPQVPVLMVCGVGMSLYFAPTANLVMASVRPAEQGIASGANNAMREVGGALGVAVLSAVFSARGGYGSTAAFTDGLVPALLVGAGAIGAGAVAAALVPRRHGLRPAGAVRPEAVPA